MWNLESWFLRVSYSLTRNIINALISKKLNSVHKIQVQTLYNLKLIDNSKVLLLAGLKVLISCNLSCILQTSLTVIKKGLLSMVEWKLCTITAAKKAGRSFNWWCSCSISCWISFTSDVEEKLLHITILISVGNNCSFHLKPFRI